MGGNSKIKTLIFNKLVISFAHSSPHHLKIPHQIQTQQNQGYWDQSSERMGKLEIWYENSPSVGSHQD